MSDNEKRQQVEDALAVKLLEAADMQVQYGNAGEARELVAAYVALRESRPESTDRLGAFFRQYGDFLAGRRLDPPLLPPPASKDGE